MNANLTLFSNENNEAKDIDLIKGLLYIQNFINPIEEQKLMQLIDSQIWLLDLKRRVQHYGFKYDYKARRIDDSMHLGGLPMWLTPLSKRLFDEGFCPKMPDQVIINEYEIGQGISPHIDCEPCFEDTIVSLSLNTTVLMDFLQQQTLEKVSILLEPRSIVILQGESRYNWKHGIAARQKDIKNNIVFPRKRRISLTFRRVIL